MICKKIGHLEKLLARLIGGAIGTVNGKKYAQKAYQAEIHQRRLRQDAEFKQHQRYNEISGED
jgi:hypothetical protein